MKKVNFRCLQLNGSYIYFWCYKYIIYRNIINPKFIIASFQSDRQNNQLKDASQFDTLNIKTNRIKLNISESNYAIMYEMYQDYKKT